MIKIEKNIPPPSQRKYPRENMEIGDSFFVPDEKISNINPPRGGKARNWKFTRRTEKGGVRVWRIK